MKRIKEGMMSYIYSREYGQIEFSARLSAHLGSGTLMHPNKSLDDCNLRKSSVESLSSKRAQPRLDLLLFRLTAFWASFSTRLLSIDRAVLCRSRIL